MPRGKQVQHNITESQLRELYIDQNLTKDEVSNVLKISASQINTMLTKYGIKKSADQCALAKRAGMLKKYGVDNAMLVPEIREKAISGTKSALLERKDEIVEKRRSTFLERTGYDCALKNPDTIKKARDRAVTEGRQSWNNQTKSTRDKIKNTISKNLLAGKYDNIVRSRRSAGENELRDWLLSINLVVQQGNRSVLSGKEIDLYLPEHKLGIEYNGLFWHSDSDSANGISNDYHYKKYEQAKSCGVRLLTIWDKEWEENKDVVKSYILSVLNIFEKKIFARNCTFKIIDNNIANEFCDRHHFQGKTIGIKHSFCLLHNDEVVSVITFGYHHRKNTNELVLSRYCVKSGYCIIGGAEKLFVNSVKELNVDSIISWSDNRISYGRVYEKLGFELDAKLKADYFYIKSDGRTIIPKQSMQKKKCGCPDNMTEREYCKNVLKLNRVYDCGKIRWKWTQKKTPD